MLIKNFHVIYRDIRLEIRGQRSQIPTPSWAS